MIKAHVWLKLFHHWKDPKFREAVYYYEEKILHFNETDPDKVRQMISEALGEYNMCYIDRVILSPSDYTPKTTVDNIYSSDYEWEDV